MSNDGSRPTDTSGATAGALSTREHLIPETPEAFDNRYGPPRPLASGGMGEIQLVRDFRVGRDVAMKVVHDKYLDTEAVLQRFVREARVQGRLEHPSLVPVYDLGLQPDGQLYFVMKRIRGWTLQEVVRSLRAGSREMSERYPRRKLLAVVSQLCLALDFAHQHGILHRDVKPANVMLGDYGEVYLLDWGVAKVLGTGESMGGLPAEWAELREEAGLGTSPGTSAGTLADSGDDDGFDGTEHSTEEPALTDAASVVGTPGYAAPEQILHADHKLDCRVDVYGVGMLLFEVLAHEPYFDRRTRAADLAVQTLKGIDARPSVRAPALDLPPELDELCLKATATKPEDRFANLRELHDALEAHLAGVRDEELRGELAAQHEEAAAKAASKALEGGADANDHRRQAMAELGKTLALRPESPAALETLLRLITEPPSQVPREVQEQLDNNATDHLGEVLKMGPLTYGAFFLVAPFFLIMGIRDFPLTLAAGLMLVGAIVTCLVGAKQPRDIHQVLLLIFVTACLGIASRMLGPFLLIPSVLSINAQSFALFQSTRRALIFAAVASLAIVVPFGLELAGVIDPSYVFRDGHIVVMPHALSLPEVPTLLLLLVAVLGSMFVSAYWAGQVRQDITRAETQIALQTWQLRQLVPASGGDRNTSPRDTGD